MRVECSLETICQESFRALDKAVMGRAFDILKHTRLMRIHRTNPGRKTIAPRKMILLSMILRILITAAPDPYG